MGNHPDFPVVSSSRNFVWCTFPFGGALSGLVNFQTQKYGAMRHCQHLEFVLTGAIKEITRPWEGVDPPTLPVGFPGFPPSPDHAVAVEAAGEEGRGGHLDGDSLRMQAAVLLQVDWRQAEGGGR